MLKESNVSSCRNECPKNKYFSILFKKNSTHTTRTPSIFMDNNKYCTFYLSGLYNNTSLFEHIFPCNRCYPVTLHVLINLLVN